MARRLARTGRLSCHVGVGLGLALCAGCAGTPPRRAAVAEVCPEPGPPAFPNAAGPCDGAADDDPDDPPPDAADGTSCVPRYARGRELARDDARGMRVFEACLPRSRYRPAAPPAVDPRRVILVRTGGHAPTDDDLEMVVEALSKARAEAPERARRPDVAACRDDRGTSTKCVAVDLLERRPDLPRLMAELAPWLAAVPGACVPLRIQFGVPEGCPPDPVTRPMPAR